MDDGTFPALLKTLSDTSEEVIKYDLQLLAQISSLSEETYFRSFMINLLELFSTDRRLLDQRGSLIIRQLCLNLNTEKIYRTFAEILEKEEVSDVCVFHVTIAEKNAEDLEFASVMVQKLNIILITSPELGDFRKRLKGVETRVRVVSFFCSALEPNAQYAARRTGSVHHSIPFLVSQRRCRLFIMSIGTGIRTCL